MDIVVIHSHLGLTAPGAMSYLPVETARIKVAGNLAQDCRSIPSEESKRAVGSLAIHESVNGFNDVSPAEGVQRMIARTAEASEAIQRIAATRLAMQCRSWHHIPGTARLAASMAARFFTGCEPVHRSPVMLKGVIGWT